MDFDKGVIVTMAKEQGLEKLPYSHHPLDSTLELPASGQETKISIL